MKHKLIDEQEARSLIINIARSITLDKWRPDYIVGITRGGLVPALFLSHFFDIPMHTLKVSLRDGIENCETNCWMSEDAFDGKNILIVDDINDSGNTINWILKDWQGSCLPTDDQWGKIWNNNVRFAVLVDNMSSESKVNIDYVGRTVNKFDEDVWIDFPWEVWWKI